MTTRRSWAWWDIPRAARRSPRSTSTPTSKHGGRNAVVAVSPTGTSPSLSNREQVAVPRLPERRAVEPRRRAVPARFAAGDAREHHLPQRRVWKGLGRSPSPTRTSPATPDCGARWSSAIRICRTSPVGRVRGIHQAAQAGRRALSGKLRGRAARAARHAHRRGEPAVHRRGRGVGARGERGRVSQRAVHRVLSRAHGEHGGGERVRRRVHGKRTRTSRTSAPRSPTMRRC